MITKDILQKQEVFRICADSVPIHPGDRFEAVANDSLSQMVHGKELTDILCCGLVNEGEMLFSAEGGRYYFSFSDGWGVQDNTLYGLTFGLFFHFKHPTTKDNIAEECKRHYGSYNTWGGAMAAQHRRSILDTISLVVGRNTF